MAHTPSHPLSCHHHETGYCLSQRTNRGDSIGALKTADFEVAKEGREVDLLAGELGPAPPGHPPLYSITSSARSRIDVGSSIPIALAVLRLTAISNFVACSTGKSPAFAPLRILAT